jgi:hypothetical protein
MQVESGSHGGLGSDDPIPALAGCAALAIMTAATISISRDRTLGYTM